MEMASEPAAAAFAAEFGVSRETVARLDAYAALLRRWNRRINLVAPGALDALWHRHIADSAQLFDLAPSSAGSWIDLGSGAGLPGLVVAAIAAEKRPGLGMRLVESDLRKAAVASGGQVVVTGRGAALVDSVDSWTQPGAELPLMRRLKERFDPRHILNPGRFVGGL